MIKAKIIVFVVLVQHFGPAAGIENHGWTPGALHFHFSPWMCLSYLEGVDTSH